MKKFSLLLTVLLATSAFMGCQNKKSDDVAAAPITTPTPTNPDGSDGTGVDGSGTSTSGGSTVTFKPVSLAEMVKYVGTHPLNDPKNYRLTVDLTRDTNLKFSGNVQISYEDNGRLYTGYFESADSLNVNFSGKSYDNGVNESAYNYWYRDVNSKTVFSGFFQDAYGAVILIVDNYVNTGDGSGSGYASGTVWYKNFAQSVNPQSPYRKCWFLYDGPYMCRSNNIINKSSLDPSDGGYRKLGTFSGLAKAAAFK